MPDHCLAERLKLLGELINPMVDSSRPLIYWSLRLPSYDWGPEMLLDFKRGSTISG